MVHCPQFTQPMQAKVIMNEESGGKEETSLNMESGVVTLGVGVSFPKVHDAQNPEK